MLFVVRFETSVGVCAEFWQTIINCFAIMFFLAEERRGNETDVFNIHSNSHNNEMELHYLINPLTIPNCQNICRYDPTWFNKVLSKILYA